MTNLWISFYDEQGEGISVPITGVGGTIRLCVGKVGERSSVWRIWANKRSSDVYIAARNIADVQKFSLHQSGVWRYAWTATGAEGHVPEGQDRVIDRWHRGDEEPNGWNDSLIIRVRSEDVTPIPGDAQPEEGVRWLPKPPAGMTAGIHVVMANPDKGVAKMPSEARLVDALALPNGQAVFVMADQYTPSPDVLAGLTAARQEAMRLPGLQDAVGEHPMRLGVFGNLESGVRFVWDTAL
jgi:hypothetical protein